MGIKGLPDEKQITSIFLSDCDDLISVFFTGDMQDNLQRTGKETRLITDSETDSLLTRIDRQYTHN